MNQTSRNELSGQSWTIRSYASQWLQTTAPASLAPSTVDHYRWMVGGYIVPIIGDVPLAELSPWHVCHLLIRIHDAGYSAGTGRAVAVVLRSMLWQAKRDQLVDRNVAAQVEAPRRTWPHYLAVNGYESRERTKAAGS